MPDRATALAAALEADIHAGRLAPGARLPTHRALAEAHGVAVNTATRAMRLLVSRGLAVGEVGRGSFVRAPAQADAVAFRDESRPAGLVDLSRNTMPLPGLTTRFREAAHAVLRQEAHLDGYGSHAGRAADRQAAAAWLARGGLPGDPERVVVCAGAQHAAFVALLATTRPGDAVAVEALTWPGFKTAADALRLRLVPVPLDADGLRPRALMRLAARHRIAALYLMPGMHNPTSAVMPATRREAVATLARRLDFQVIESDVYGFLADDPAPPIAALAPERTWLTYGTSKAFAPGLRCAWLWTPPGAAARATDLVRTTIWAVPPLGPAIAARWVSDGTAERLVAARRAEATARQALAASHLPPGWRTQSHPASTHLWLHLPAGLRTDEAEARALAAGVRVAPGGAFAVGSGPSALRLSLSAPERRADLVAGLQALSAALAS